MNSGLEPRVDWRIGSKCALALSLLFGTLAWVNDLTGVSFLLFFARQLVLWFLWLALAPVVFAINARVRRRGWQRPGTIAYFIAAGVFVSVLHATLGALVRAALGIAAMPNVGVAIANSIVAFFTPNHIRFWLISAVYHAIAYHHEVRAREASLARAQLESLEGRLQPHFLFNTLNAITALIREDPRAAEGMVGHLSELLRAALDAPPGREVTLQRELELLEHYLAIQRARFQERLHVSIDSEPGTLGACVPHLILLPIVENAIRHGIAPRETPGTVRIRSTRDGDTLRLFVQDDGVGLNGAASSVPGHGLGLSSTKARLAHLYAGAGTLHLGDVLPHGTLASIALPFHTA